MFIYLLFASFVLVGCARLFGCGQSFGVYLKERFGVGWFGSLKLISVFIWGLVIFQMQYLVEN